MSIKVENLTHTYNPGTAFEKKAIDNLNFEIKDGEFVGLIGHTGSGKSTLIQHFNALLAPTSGKVYFNGEDINADKTKLKYFRTRIGLVFQYPEYQLFETTVFADVAFGPKNMGLSDEEIEIRVKEALSIPVIGNGDVVDGPSAKRMFEETGCDGVMIARAAQGNPFLFREVKSFFEKGEACPRPDKKEIYDTVIRHADLQLQYKGEYIGIREMRKHVSWYTYGMPGSARFRNQINQMENMDSLKAACALLFEQEL